MKKLLSCFLVCVLLAACSKDENTKLKEPQSVDFVYANQDDVTDHQVLVYDEANSDEYLGIFNKSTLDLVPGKYKLVAIGNGTDLLRNIESYQSVKIIQSEDPEMRVFAARKTVDLPVSDKILFDMEQINGGLQIVSADDNVVGLDSVKVIVKGYNDSFQLYNLLPRGNYLMTIPKTFNTEEGAVFDETIYVFPGDFEASLEYYIGEDVVATKDFGKIKIEAGKSIVKEIRFAEDIVRGVDIPDASFFAALKNVLPAEAFAAGRLLPDHESVNNLNELDISRLQIQNLSGIECFINLNKLNCSSNKIDSLDFSALENLKDLNCEFCSAKFLDVSKCTLLENLNFSANKITSIDLTQNIKLSNLNCSLNFGFTEGTSLEQLDLTANSELVTINASACKLQSLDLSGKNLLKEINCEGNFAIYNIDFSGCTSLENLYCQDNKISSLDLSDCSALKIVDCESNYLSDLILSESASGLVQIYAQGINQTYTDIPGLSASNQPLLSKLFIGKSALCGENIKTFYSEGNWSLMRWGHGSETSLTDYTLESCQ